MDIVEGREWVRRTLVDEQGFQVKMQHSLTLHTDRLAQEAYQTRTIGPSIERTVTKWGSIRDLLGKLASDHKGLWYYMGWIDQAILHIGKVESGTADHLVEMLRQFDDDQVDQAGDMIVGFASPDRQWVFEIEASPDEDAVSIAIRSNSGDPIALASATLGISIR